MATVSKHIADELAANDGYYHQDPRVMRIVEYINIVGGLAYGIEYSHDIGKYASSEFVRNPRVYWEAGEGESKLILTRLSRARFRMEGNWGVGDAVVRADHFQLIYEALEIAANSTDPFAKDFAKLRDELLELSRDWAEQ